MSISQREVYLLPFPLDSSVEDHPFIVLSCQEANEYERTFIGVMITTTLNKDDYSFPLVNEMFESPLAKPNSHVRMHLLSLYVNEEIRGRRLNRMKEQYFKQLMAFIGDIIFNYEFKPNK